MCLICDAEDHKAVCGACLLRLRKALASCADLEHLLDDEAAGLSVKASNGGGSGAGDSISYFLGVKTRLNNALRTLYVTGGFAGAESQKTPALAHLLVRRAYQLQDYEGERANLVGAVEDVFDAVRGAWRAVDNRPEMVSLGACGECQAGHVRAVRGAPVGWCSVCGASYDARALSESRREQVLDELGGSWLSSKDMAAAFTALGLELRDATIRQWGTRGHVQKHGSLYLFDDVMDYFERKALARR